MTAESQAPLAPKRRWKPLACGCLAVSGTLVALAVPVLVFVLRPDPQPDPPLLAIRASGESITALAFSPRGDLLASAGRDMTIRLWNPRDGRLLQEAKAGGLVEQLVITADGSKLGAASCYIQIFAVSSDALAAFDVPMGDPDERARFSASLDHFVTREKFGDGAFSRSLAPGGKATNFSVRGPNTTFFSLALSPDGKRAAFGFDDGTVLDYTTSDCRLFADWSARRGAICGLAFSSHDDLAVGANDGKVAVYGPRGGSVWFKADRTPVAFAFSPDCKLLAAADLGGVAIVWDLEGNLPPLRWHVGRDNMLYAVAFSPDGERIATAGEDGTIRIFPAR